MANIKSAKKRILVAKTRNERNKSEKSAVKTAIKKVEAAVAANDKAAAEAALLSATSIIDKAAKKRRLSQEQCSEKSISSVQGSQHPGISIDLVQLLRAADSVISAALFVIVQSKVKLKNGRKTLAFLRPLF